MVVRWRFARSQICNGGGGMSMVAERSWEEELAVVSGLALVRRGAAKTEAAQCCRFPWCVNCGGRSAVVRRDEEVRRWLWRLEGEEEN